MTADSNFGSGLSVVAALLAIPVVTMGVVMPLMLLGGWGPMAVASPWVLFTPVLPITVFALVGYALYSGRDGRHEQPTTDDGGPISSTGLEVSPDE